MHSVNVGNVRLVPVRERGIRSKLKCDKGEKGHVRPVAALCNFRVEALGFQFCRRTFCNFGV